MLLLVKYHLCTDQHEDLYLFVVVLSLVGFEDTGISLPDEQWIHATKHPEKNLQSMKACDGIAYLWQFLIQMVKYSRSSAVDQRVPDIENTVLPTLIIDPL